MNILEEGKNDLKSQYPQLAREWLAEKNNGLMPEQVSYGSKRIAWWRGTCGHEWDMPIWARTGGGQGCPFCSGRRVLKGFNDFSSLAGDLIEEWNVERNDFLPDEITAYSNKKVWWKGRCGHEWDMPVVARTKAHQGCPYCAGRRVLKGFNDFASQSGDMILEWDWEKNKDIDPTTISLGSNKRVWWRCKKGHSWMAIINSRVNKKNGCPFCSNQRVWSGYNDLKSSEKASWYLELWDYDKNDISPEMVSVGSNVKIWWKCKFGHSWQASVKSVVVSKTGCPQCSMWQHSSMAEQIVYYYIHKMFPDAISGFRPDFLQRTSEIDVFVPKYKLGIEYDGQRWHTTNNLDRDKEKSRILQQHGILLYRIREPKCKELHDSSIEIYTEKPTGSYKYLETAIEKIFQKIMDSGIDVSLAMADNYVNVERDYLAIRSQFDSVKIKKSLASINPNLAREWDYEKNSGVSPDSVSANSQMLVWWRCDLGHSYKAPIGQRNGKKSGCPYCSYRRVLKGFNDLESQCPDLLLEWDFQKNTARPDRVSCKSGKMFWWICQAKHSYKTSVKNKIEGPGDCPYCAGRLPIAGKTDFATLFPQIAEEWDYDKNKGVRPEDILPFSGQKVWWICSKCNFSWCSVVARRTAQQSGCPKCIKRVIDEDDNLAITNPEVAKDWDYGRNGELLPTQVKKGSHKSVWWKCSVCGNRWSAVINNRVRGAGCPVCGKTLRKRREYLTQYPDLCKEWDTDKNGFECSQVASKSNTKRWWICAACSFEWQAPPFSRVKGSGCPACKGRVATKTNNIGILFPNLCAEWNHDKNANDTPENTLPKSRKRIWWRCIKCGCEWQAPPYSRVIGSGCPQCAKTRRKRI